MSANKALVTRLATRAEADRTVEVILAARRSAVPAIPPLVHTDEEVRSWFADAVMPTCEVWVVDVGSAIAAVMVLADDWIEQLYVHPDHTNRGIGSTLLVHAQSLADATLDLWTFESNVGARRFYLRHGFVEVDRTDGDNEEGEPDVRMRWTTR